MSNEKPLPKPEEIYAPADLDVEQLFEAEGKLREAAIAYQAAEPYKSTSAMVRDARKKLRDAARYYARVVEFFQGKD